MKNVMIMLFFVIMIAPIMAQDASDQEQVQKACLNYIEGFYEGDTSKLIQSVDKEVFKYGYYKGRNSTAYAGEAMSFQQMLDYANNVKAKGNFAKPTAPKKVEVFEVQDQTASAKVTAWWGTDYILLAKLNDKWMIRSVLWQGPLKAPNN